MLQRRWPSNTKHLRSATAVPCSWLEAPKFASFPLSSCFTHAYRPAQVIVTACLASSTDVSACIRETSTSIAPTTVFEQLICSLARKWERDFGTTSAVVNAHIFVRKKCEKMEHSCVLLLQSSCVGIILEDVHVRQLLGLPWRNISWHLVSSRLEHVNTQTMYRIVTAAERNLNWMNHTPSNLREWTTQFSTRMIN